MASNSTVYHGIWTNWSKGTVFGSTLTVSNRNGAIIIAAMALFIQLAGTASWSIICFILHQVRTTRQAKDGLYHQQQVTLRNNSSDAMTIWQLANLGWFWRSKRVKSWRRSASLVLLGLLHFLAFATAGILSSHFTTLGNEVQLSRRVNCGLWDPGLSITNQSSLPEFVAYNVYEKENTQLSKGYVRDCLQQSKSLSSQCNTYKRPYLSWNSSTRAPCPFDDSMCLGPANSAVEFDSGLIDSRDDLGINTDNKNRVQLRKTMTCTPLVRGEYIRIGNTSYGGMSFNYSAAFYGPDVGTNSYSARNAGIPNITYIHTSYQAIEFPIDLVTEAPYKVGAVIGWPGITDDGYQPIPLMDSPNSVLTLAFASYSGVYTAPSNDLWLTAQRPILEGMYGAGTGNITKLAVYQLNHTISPLGCTEQHQICNPNRNSNGSANCTPLMSLNKFDIDADNDAPILKSVLDTAYQITIAQVLTRIAKYSQLITTITSLDSSLLASDLVSEGSSVPLADNQWVLEVNNWFSIAMVNLQRYIVNVATGPPGSYVPTPMTGPDPGSAEMYTLCGSQIIQQEGFTNFSVLAISLVFGLGGLIIFVNMILDMLVSWIQLRYKRGLFHQVRWQLDSKLQLQRMAFEEVGLGTWKGGADEVPVTEKKEVFAPACEWDDWHPSIRGKAAGSPSLDRVRTNPHKF